MNILMFGTGGLAQYLVSKIKEDINILAYINSEKEIKILSWTLKLCCRVKLLIW